ncbi:MAG: hypothetical protein DSY53_03265 [Persephonella sp.]|nr:MAG: hypothetical protein DSY53_03265 [Persephonella sp.]
MNKRTLLVFMTVFFTSFYNSFAESYATTTELLDQAQQSIKEAFEAGCPQITPYEYYKAEAYYKLAKEEASLLNLEAGQAAAENSISWSLKAIMKRYDKDIIKRHKD